METTEPGKYLYKFYKKEIHSFLVHLDRAKAKPDEKNIHELRTGIKKMRAVLNLLEMIFSNRFNARKHYAVFKDVFKTAGEIRKVQVNRIYFAKYKVTPLMAGQYKKFLVKREDRFNSKFKKVCYKVDSNLLDKSKNRIKKLCEITKAVKIIKECQSFIKRQAGVIEQLLAAGDNPVIIHKIRMHLKNLNAIGALYYKISPDAELKKALKLTVSNAGMIGEWHDRVILGNSLETFFRENGNIQGNQLASLMEVLSNIKHENQFFFKKMKNQLSPILKNIKNLEEFKIPT